jgi:chromosome segregation ATPase
MKRLCSLLVVGVLVAGGGYAVYKWSPKFRAAVKKVDNQIDEWIGPFDVQREEIADRIKKLDTAIDGLETEQFRAEAEANTQTRHIKDQKAKIRNAEASLGEVRNHLTEVATTKKPITLGGKEYTESDLDAMAKKIIAKHKDWSTELSTQEDKLQALQKRADRFKARKEELATQLAAYKKDLKAIDEKIREAESLKKASAAMGDADKTVGENAEDLKKSIDDLHAKIDLRLKKEDRNWEKVGKSGDDTEKFIEATKGTSPDTLSEIDAILKSKK